MPDSIPTSMDRFLRPTSRMVGLYQALLIQQLNHFFPDATLEVEGDRGSIQWTYLQDVPNFRLAAQGDGVGLSISWFGTNYQFYPRSPAPLRSLERRLVETIVRYLDHRFQGLMELASSESPELFAMAMEDMIVTEFLSPPYSSRMPMALEALRVAALTTYEDSRVASAALLLGTENDPAYPDRRTPGGAPRYHVGMTAIKGLHRICDGQHTAFVVDRRGQLAWAVDLSQWVELAGMPQEVKTPCPRRYLNHARATLEGNHCLLVLTATQEIKVFTKGQLAFNFTNARWRLMDIPSKYADWCKALGESIRPGLAFTLFQAALNLSDTRTGALIAVLRDPERSLPELVAPGDRVVKPLDQQPQEPMDEPLLHPRMAKRVLHHLVTGRDVFDLDGRMLESLASIDGALVTDRQGKLHSFGAILRLTAEAIHSAQAVDGARSVAALAASFHGPVLKISQDGFISMYLSGRRVWDL